MKRVRSRTPSFYFAIYALNQLYPESNTVHRFYRKGDWYYIEVDKIDEETMCYRQLKDIQDDKVRREAYSIDFIMRLVGQGGSNIVVNEGKCYTNWTTFKQDCEHEINVTSYNSSLLSMIFASLGDLDEFIFQIESEHDVDLTEIKQIIRMIWPH